MGIAIVLTLIAGLIALAAAGFRWWWRRQQKSPAERERLRRMAVNATGRFTEGFLLEAPFSPAAPPTPDLLFYRYRASGMEYTAAQDVSTLADRIRPESSRPGALATVKYDPRRPSNSIIICELWSGLYGLREDARHSGPGE